MTPTTPGDDENGTAVVSNMPSAAPSRLGSHSEDHLPSRPSTGSQGGNIIKAVELAYVPPPTTPLELPLSLDVLPPGGSVC